MKLFSDTLSTYQIVIDIGLPVILVFLSKWTVGKLVPPCKELQVLLNQINAYHSNIYGRLYSMKNGSVRVRFMNRKSLRPNKKGSYGYINLSRNADGTYHVLFDYEMADRGNLSIDQLREKFTLLWHKQSEKDSTFAIDKIIEIGTKKGIIKNSVWTNSSGLITSPFDDSQPYCCFIEGVNYCYALSCSSDAKISIKVLPLSWYEAIQSKTNLDEAISAAAMIVNKIPDWLPQFLKNRLFVYYPWGCNMCDAFKAIRYWEKTGYKSYYECNGKFIRQSTEKLMQNNHRSKN